MSKRTRQYLGLLSAVLAYYLIHEGAHLVYALMTNTFKQINFMGLGVQIDICAEQMTEVQLGIFCVAGPVATMLAAYVLTALGGKIAAAPSQVFRACMYYITLALLLIDPLYLSVLCGFFGGGDMNGISLLIPESAARVLWAVLLVLNGLVYWKIVLPKYKLSFERTNKIAKGGQP